MLTPRLSSIVFVLVFASACGGDDSIVSEPVGSGSWKPMRDGADAYAETIVGASDWNGQQLFVWGSSANRGWLYTAATDEWKSCAPPLKAGTRSGASAVWGGNRVYVFGYAASCTEGSTERGCASGQVYDVDNDRWDEMSTTSAPRGTGQHSSVWTGKELIVWGGLTGNDPRRSNVEGGTFDPTTSTWSRLPTLNAPEARIRHSTVWTGTKMIVWGGVGPADGISLGNGKAYDPVTQSWSDLSLLGAPAPRSFHSAAWTGTEMVIWGGVGCGGTCDDGRAYNVATDSWRTVSTTGGPGRRVRSASVWTGSEVIVWGGLVGDSGFVTGSRWDPIRDVWTPMATEGAPIGRGGAFAFWAGERMLVWGGETGRGGVGLSSGGYYTP